MSQAETIECQLLVIGAGMAGMASALFAAQRGIPTVQVGVPGEIIYASGLVDLLGVHPVAKGRLWRNPWAAIAAVKRDAPNHPYARLGVDKIRCALDQFLASLPTADLPYRHYKDRNVELITPAGTLKRTYAAPQSMWSGGIAWQQRRACLLVDFHGLKGFSAAQIQSILHPHWPKLTAARIAFPDVPYELYPERMAQALERDENRRVLADRIQARITDARVVGLPAICGLYRSKAVMSDLQRRIGLPIFEIPTMPPSITGVRLKNALQKVLADCGVRGLYQHRILQIRPAASGDFVCQVGEQHPQLAIKAQAAILATGRFIGGGLAADRTGIHEPLFNLPVVQPPGRPDWHRTDFLDPRGHGVNQAGLEIDDRFRPLNDQGQPAYANLFAAGSVLAHADWIRMKCGSGLAIASAYGAVQGCEAHLSPGC